MAVTTTTLNASADTYISSNTPTTAYGAGSDLYAGEYNAGADVTRTLIKFDLSGLPAGATIVGARLRIKDIASNFSSNNRDLKVYRMIRAWTEGTATWNTTDGSTSWGTAGAGNTTSDRESGSIATLATPATEVAQYYDIQLTASSVNEMFNGTLTNNGFMLKMDTETDDMHRYYSRTGTDVPQLIIDYVIAGESGVLLNPTADCNIRDDSTTTNVNGQNLYTGERATATNIFRSLLKFDMSSIPQSAIITGAILRIYDKGTADWATSTGVVKVYRCLRDWVENQVCWNNYSTGNAWATAGAGNTTTDREATEVGTSGTLPSTEVPVYYDISITGSAIQSWVSGSLTNNGFIMKTEAESNDMHEFLDRLAVYPPQLVISYSLPNPTNPMFFSTGGLTLG